MKWPEWDRSLLLMINEGHNEFLDSVMWWAGKPLTWIPLYLFLLFVFIRKYGAINTGFLILAYLVLIFGTDFLNLHCIKNTVQRLRPTHEPGLSGTLHLLIDENGSPYLGGMYGFISSHAANHFGIAFLSANLTKRWFKFAPLIFYIWAFVIAYSRVYMGVHYPLDVICGGLYGIAVGWIVINALHYIAPQMERNTIR